MLALSHLRPQRVAVAPGTRGLSSASTLSRLPVDGLCAIGIVGNSAPSVLSAAFLGTFCVWGTRSRLWSRGRLPFRIPLSSRSRLRGVAGARRQLALLLRLPAHHAEIACRAPRLRSPCGLRFPLEIWLRSSAKISPEPP